MIFVLCCFLVSLALFPFSRRYDLRPALADFFINQQAPADCLRYQPLKSFLGGIIKGIGKVAGAVGSVAKVIPGVGTAVAAGANAVSAVLGGGTATTTKTTTGGQTQSTTIGTQTVPMQTSFFDKIMKPGPLGVPVIVWGAVLVGGGFLLWRKLRKRG